MTSNYISENKSFDDRNNAKINNFKIHETSLNFNMATALKSLSSHYKLPYFLTDSDQYQNSWFMKFFVAKYILNEGCVSL